MGPEKGEKETIYIRKRPVERGTNRHFIRNIKGGNKERSRSFLNDDDPTVSAYRVQKMHCIANENITFIQPASPLVTT